MSWLELFFELVVIAAIAQLAHRQGAPSGAVLPLLLGVLGWELSNALLLWALVAIAAWPVLYGRLDRRSGTPQARASAP